ncbi:MAG: TetR family transcriptional regulator [Actinomycetales bacterium]|nr:TetR family transcriptional regulator [Actinomycetales bacterium]
METTRSYTMTARARAVEETRSRIIESCVSMYGERPVPEVGLDDIAARAEVSVQTVLRHFGSRSGLEEAAFERARDAVLEERRAPVGDVDAAVRVIVDHYELRGDSSLLMLAQEGHQPLMARVTTEGKSMHRAWVQEVFAPYLTAAADHEELANLLVVATDVYTWKLLRRDRRMGRDRTERQMRHLVQRVLGVPMT